MIRRLRGFYFLYYAGVGVFLGYFAPWLRGLGFTGRQIGAISMLQQVAGALAGLVWGHLADRVLSPARALRICSAGALLATAALPFARTPVQMGLVLCAAAAFAGALVPLVDAVTVNATGSAYARTRLYGSLGFIVTAQALGMLLAARGERPGDLAMPVAYVACVAGFAALAQGMPESGAHPDRPHLRDAVALLRNPRLVVLFAACAAHWGALAPYHLLFGVLVREQRLSSGVTGLAMSAGVLAEVLALQIFPLLDRRVPLRGLFAAAYLVSALRWALLSRAQGAAALVLLQLLHGLTFGVWWAASVATLRRAVPARLRATGQALFSALVFAGGNAAGYALAGAGYDRFGSAAPLFAAAAAVELIPLALLVVPLPRAPADT